MGDEGRGRNLTKGELMAIALKKREAIAARLEQIRLKNDGVLRPEDVVQDAKNPKSILHGEFEWDDSAAAVQFRLDQARALIRSVKVEVTTTSDRLSVPYYIRDPRTEPNEQGYAPTMEIRTNTAVAQEALTAELDRAVALLERAMQIAEALGLADRVSVLLTQLRVVREAVTEHSTANAV
jgi:hypothetical protein